MSTIFDTDTLNDFVPAQINYNAPQSPLMRLWVSMNEKPQPVIIATKREAPEFVFLSGSGKYYNTKAQCNMKPSDVRYSLSVRKGRNISTQELIDKTNDNTIPQVIDICYSPVEKEGYYNTFDPSTILQPSTTPRLHPSIDFLLDNLTHWDKSWKEWIHKCILFKYSHLGEINVPCVSFYGVWGSWKSTFMKLLGGIFGYENVHDNIKKGELESQFDVVKGDKLIYEFAEITTNNSQVDRGIQNKLKNIIFAPRISVNEKGEKLKRNLANYGWFLISSNSNRPILLDSDLMGNRRFSFFKSEHELTKEEANMVHIPVDPENPLYDKNALSDYIAWLYQEYPEVIHLRKFEAYENEDKALVVQNSESKLDEFVRYLKEEYPFNELWVKEVDTAIDMFMLEYGDCDRYSLKNLFESFCPFRKTKTVIKRLNRNVAHYILK